VYSKEQFAKLMDSSLLKPTATREEVIRCCQQAKKYHFAAVLTFPFWMPVVSKELAGSDVKPGAVISFPFGMNSRAVKIFEARTAISNGAQELDVVANIGAIKSGELGVVQREITELIESIRVTGMTEDARRTLIKVIVEMAYLTEREKIAVCEIVRDSGADFIKTSTGTAPTGATVEDIRLIRGVVGPDMGVKAAGGIRTAAQAVAMLDAGASRIGTSTAAQIVDSYVPEDYMEGAESNEEREEG